MARVGVVRGYMFRGPGMSPGVDDLGHQVKRRGPLAKEARERLSVVL